nr:unnamed protein product [Callosobruchus chinensis]
MVLEISGLASRDDVYSRRDDLASTVEMAGLIDNLNITTDKKVEPCDAVKSLGLIIIDSKLRFRQHVNSVISKCYLALKNLYQSPGSYIQLNGGHYPEQRSVASYTSVTNRVSRTASPISPTTLSPATACGECASKKAAEKA